MKILLKISCLVIALCAGLSLQAQTTIVINIDPAKTAQTIQNFAASGCWYSEPIGLYWADSVKEQMAKLLFSRKADRNGNPEGIGLSGWRFNIGAGTAEQGDSSGIKDINRRVACFLNADGTYNWNKQQGYLWFTKKAHDYGVENLIAFVNSPPVFYTHNGLGYKTEKTSHTNLKADKYNAYADFLAEVLTHFDKQHLHFNYISPVNEPQWEWYDKYGEATQEGSPYTNQEIFDVLKPLNAALLAKHLSTTIIMPEAGMLTYLYGMPNSLAGKQIQRFWQPDSPLYVGKLKNVERLVAGHGYFTEVGDKNLISTRKNLADTAKKYNVDYWQSEYSMLGDGFKEGSKDKRSAFDCAMFLAKLIHHDLTEGNASAWQFWNSWEPGAADFNTRYYLLALKPSADFRSGSFTITKNLWALGHFSLFVRPGMKRIHLDEPADKDLLISAFSGKKRLVVVAINNSANTKLFRVNIPQKGFGKSYKYYVTTAAADDNMKLYTTASVKDALTMKPRSIYTLVIE